MTLHTKRFHLEDVQRIPVTLTDTARDAILASSHQGRLWPQALSELCAERGCIACVSIDVVCKSAFHPVSPTELHPVTGEEPLLFYVVATHAVTGVPDYTWLINVSDLSQVYPRGDFQAVTSVQEMLRLYPYT